MLRTLTTLMAVIAIPQGVLASTVVISDGDFSLGDYELVTDGSIGLNLSITDTSIPIGGNPGAFLQVTHTAGNLFQTTELAFAWHFNTAQVYDPADGAILSIDYTEDSINIFGPPQAGHLALRQDGILYRSEQSFVTGASNASFTSNQLLGIGAEAFEGFFNGLFFPTADPDFSENGSPIEFGFLRTSVAGGGFNDSSGIDNFVVTLTVDAIPEPTAIALCVCFSGTSLLRRKRLAHC